MKQQLKRSLLVVLAACDGLPMPEDAMISAVMLNARPDMPTKADVVDALRAVESDGYVCGLTDDLTGRSWSLTEKGKHRARTI